MNLQENVILKPYTNYKIGGPARYFVAAQSEQDVQDAVAFARQKKIDYFVLGGGTNVLVSDKGYNGLVLFINMKLFSLDGDTVSADAGVAIQDLVNLSIEHGLAGLEWAGGLPGQLGGAIRGNAGAFGGEMKDSIVSVRALTPKGDIREFTSEESRFAYRSSIFKEEPDYVVLSARMRLTPGDKEQLRKKADEWINWRQTKHPLEYGNCGSVFKRVAAEDVPKEVFEKYPHVSNAIREGQVATAFFIDECGLKNKRIGGAEISDKHPNFIVNKTGDAKAEDVIILSNIIKSAVLEKFDIYLEEEVQHLGF